MSRAASSRAKKGQNDGYLVRDLYSGVVPGEYPDWPFDAPLVVEVEVERTSGRITAIYLSPELPGLARLVRRLTQDRHMAALSGVAFDLPEVCHGSYVGAVQAGLVLALKEFKEHRFDEYLAGLWLAAAERGGPGLRHLHDLAMGLSSPAA